MPRIVTIFLYAFCPKYTLVPLLASLVFDQDGQDARRCRIAPNQSLRRPSAVPRFASQHRVVGFISILQLYKPQSDDPLLQRTPKRRTTTTTDIPALCLTSRLKETAGRFALHGRAQFGRPLSWPRSFAYPLTSWLYFRSYKYPRIAANGPVCPVLSGPIIFVSHRVGDDGRGRPLDLAGPTELALHALALPLPLASARGPTAQSLALSTDGPGLVRPCAVENDSGR
jgi:hypothetical protein